MPDTKPGLLLIGGATERMHKRFAAEFTVHEAARIDDLSAWLAENAGGIIAVATNGHDGVPPEVMAALPDLKIISCYGVGYDSIDAEAAARRGIVVTHTPNVLNDEVANTAILLLLGVARDFVANDAYVRAGRWTAEGNAPLSRSIKGMTVGILGLGRIGETIAEKLQVFGCDVVYHSRSEKDVPYRYFADLTEMAEASDALICITPGGASTRRIVNAQVLNALGPRGILVNVARGSVVDEPALIAALQEGRLGGAGLDVFEAEPVVPEAFFSMKNVILQPHVGSATEETRQAMGDLTCDNLSQYLKDGSTISPVPECADL